MHVCAGACFSSVRTCAITYVCLTLRSLNQCSKVAFVLYLFTKQVRQVRFFLYTPYSKQVLVLVILGIGKAAKASSDNTLPVPALVQASDRHGSRPALAPLASVCQVPTRRKTVLTCARTRAANTATRASGLPARDAAHCWTCRRAGEGQAGRQAAAQRGWWGGGVLYQSWVYFWVPAQGWTTG